VSPIAVACHWLLLLLSRLLSAQVMHGAYLAGSERRPCSLAACSGLARIVRIARQVRAEGSERGIRYGLGVPRLGDHYPGPAVVVIEPERRAVRHRLLDGRDDLGKQTAVGEVDLFYAFLSRPGPAHMLPLP
jgi:hypothetical protein